jgi:hypothetical protein
MHKFWPLLVVPIGGVVLSWLYTLVAIPRWKAVAYSRVRNVHQLQRAAELERLISKKDSPADIHLLVGFDLAIRLRELEARFLEPDVVDDGADIPADTPVFRKESFSLLRKRTPREPVAVLSEHGIETGTTAFIPWTSIRDERVALKDFGSDNRFCLAYSYPGGHASVSVEECTVTPGEIDHLLVVYRARASATVAQ